MKKVIILILTFSFAFSGTVYLAYGASPSLEVNGFDLTDYIDIKGGISVGYNHPVYQSGQMGLDVGGSYNIMPQTYTIDGTEYEAGFMNIYALPKYAMNEQIALWMALGLSIPTHDIDDGDTGTVMGFGMSYKVSQTWSVGLGYIMNSFEESDPGDQDDEIDFTDMKIYIGYSM